MPHPTRTPAEIADLHLQWDHEPGLWDIEDTAGFEAHHDELLAYRMTCEARWAAERTARRTSRMAALGIPGNDALLDYLETMEYRIAQLEARLVGD